MFKKFIKDSLIYTIPSLVSKSTSFILIPLYSRILNPTEFGSFDLFLIFTNFINLTISLEITQAVARFYVDENDINKRITIVSTSFWFTLICYSLFYIISLFFSIRLSEFIMGSKKFYDTFKFGLFYIYLSGIFYFIQNQLRWDLKSIEYSILAAINAIATVFFTILFCKFYNFGFNGILFALLLSSIISLLYGVKKIKDKIILTFSKKILFTLLNFSIPLLFSSLSVYTSNYIGRLIITKYSTLSELGIYAIAFRISSIIGLVMTGIQISLSPLIYSHHKEKETPETIAKIFRFFVFISFLISSLLIVYSNVIINIFTTKEFFSADRLLIYLIPSILFSQMYIFAPGIGIAKKTIYFIWINIFGAFLSLILNYLLIIHFGILGAAVASLFVFFILFLLFMHYSQKLYLVPHNWDSIIKFSILSIIFIIIFKIYLIKINIFIGLFIPFVTLLIAYKIKLFRNNDLFFLKRIKKII